MATKAEKAWMNKMSEFGCCVCRWYCEEPDPPPANIHHIRDKTGLALKDSTMSSPSSGKNGNTHNRKENLGR